MDLMPSNDAASAEPAAKKSKREMIFTATPVILTILGTVLAGASTGEMTQAQYYRSLAAQNQSKVADQWGFFQAKRIRGQGLEASADVVPVLARPDKIDPELVQAAADRLVQRLERAEKNVEKLRDAIAKAENGLGGANDDLRKRTDALHKTVQQSLRNAQDIRSKLVAELARGDVVAAFAYLGTGKLPESKDQVFDDAQVNAALKAIEERKPDSELAPLLRDVSDAALHQAIATAEGNARAFELACEPVNAALQRLDRLVHAQVQQAAGFHQGVVALDTALADVPDGMTKALQEVRAAGEAVLKSDAAVKAAAEELDGLSRAARYDYNARRYFRDARYNQRSAMLFEVEARKNAATSERFRTRSRNFFFGLLFAQAGAAIASLSLAASRKSTLWALAGVAGVAAVAFSAYVYLYM